MSKVQLTCSIVVYKNDEYKLAQAIESFLSTKLLVKLYVIDNSPTDYLKNVCENYDLEYIYIGKNLGFGKAHNLIIRKVLQEDSFHLIMNPDIYFYEKTIEKLYDFIKSNREVGLVMPKVLNPDRSIQHNCKLLPKPYNLIVRRFLGIFINLVDRSNDRYEMRFTDYDKVMEVPYLSGCFILVRNKAMRDVGVFDERFFLYAEDIDLSRRIHQKYKTIYYPKSEVYHYHEKASYKSLKLLYYHVESAFRYFNKWGWWSDKERDEVNNRILEKYEKVEKGLMNYDANRRM